MLRVSWRRRPATWDVSDRGLATALAGVRPCPALVAQRVEPPGSVRLVGVGSLPAARCSWPRGQAPGCARCDPGDRSDRSEASDAVLEHGWESRESRDHGCMSGPGDDGPGRFLPAPRAVGQGHARQPASCPYTGEGTTRGEDRPDEVSHRSFTLTRNGATVARTSASATPVQTDSRGGARCERAAFAATSHAWRQIDLSQPPPPARRWGSR